MVKPSVQKNGTKEWMVRLLLLLTNSDSILLKRHNKSASFPILGRSHAIILFHSLTHMINPILRHLFLDLSHSKLYMNHFRTIFKQYIMVLLERLMGV